MCTYVTHVAFRELLDHARRMRGPVTGFAGRDILVLFFMAEHTCQLRMLRIGAGQCVGDALVACSAVLVRHISAVGDRERLMRRMTDQTVLVDHFRGMGPVAFQAFRDISVPLMAGSAEKF